MGNGPGSIGRARDNARYERNIAFNEMNEARNRYNTTVSSETNNDIMNIRYNREDVINIEKRKAEAKLIEVRNQTKSKIVDTINKLNTGFNDHLQKKNIFLEEQNNSLKSTFQKLLGKTNDELDNLMKHVTNQNSQLEEQIEENKAVENHSKTIKSNFLKIEFDKLKYQNTILWYAFYVLLLILGIVMFFFTDLSFAFQTIVFHVLLIYPFLIYYTELLLYIVYSYSRAFFDSTKFESVYLGNY
jgi:hypothetical protein